MRGARPFALPLTLALLLATAAAARARPDTLYLKDGGVRVGRIVSRDSAYTMIRTANDNLVFANDDIARLARERVRDLPMPAWGVHGAAAIAVPLRFDLGDGFALDAGVRYLLTRGVGVRLTLSFAQWQTNYDTLLGFKAVTPQTHTFTFTTVAPRAGVFFTTSLSTHMQLLAGLDAGAAFVSAESSDTTADVQTGFSWALRTDVRVALSDRFAFLLGMRYESIPTTFVALERHAVTTGPAHGLGALVIGGGLEVGW